MCDLGEYIFKQGFEQGYEQGKKIGVFIGSIKRLMNNFDLSLEEAIDILDVDEEFRGYCIKYLSE